MAKTSVMHSMHSYSGLAPVMSIASAISNTKPDFIVSGDDLATRHLHHLHRRKGHNRKDNSLCDLIEHSLGAPESFPVVYARSPFMELAQKEGIRIPATMVIQSEEDLHECIAQLSFPLVLKADGSSGGYGTRIVSTVPEAEHAFRKLQAPPLLARAAKRALVDGDKTLLWPSLLRRRYIVNAQAYVAGREATSAAICWKGAVLAMLQFEVINKRSATGPATVLRLVENAEIAAASEKMVRRLDLSGFHGFDFMLETVTGNAYLIEINPRTTQVGHLALGPRRNLPAALYTALSGENLKTALKATENDTIALFPQEWLRDPESAFLRSGYHDVPWEEPELIRDCIRRSRMQRTWYSGSTEAQPSSKFPSRDLTATSRL